MPQSSIFIPSWHLEDIVRDSDEKEAAAFLNAYGIAFHPWVLCATGELPAWTAAQSPGEYEPGRVVVVPEPSSSQLPGGWASEAEEQGTFVIHACSDREKTVKRLHTHENFQQALIRLLADSSEWNTTDWDKGADLQVPVCLDDFMAIGVVYLLTTLLSQAMYHYENIEETRFTEFITDAARSAILQNEEQTRELLRGACEQLLEAREKFYPVDAHLIDLCLVDETLKPGELEKVAQTDHAFNLLCLAKPIEQAGRDTPAEMEILTSAIAEGKVGLIGGDYESTPSVLLPIQSQRWQLERGQEVFRKHFATTPAIWGRMRFGLSTQLPLLLKKFGMHGAYHLVLDDGIYPDEEQSHFSWEGRSGTVVDAISRIPLSVDNASSFLKLPERLAETMNHDHLACVVLARWPIIRHPWFHDILRVQQYAPVLGQFEKLDHYFDQTEDSGHHTGYEQRQYISPYLDQLTGHNAPDAISRFSHFWKLQSLQQAYAWFITTGQILSRKHDASGVIESERELQGLCSKLESNSLTRQKQILQDRVEQAFSVLAEKLIGKGTDRSGYLVINPLLQDRRTIIRIPYENSDPAECPVPALQQSVKYLQLEKDHALAIVDVPACGFTAIETVPKNQAKQTKSKAPVAGELFLQNEFFHVQLDPMTGGIQRLRLHGHSENLLSERLVFRLDGSAGIIARGQDRWGNINPTPQYSRMVADSIKTLRTGPVCGEIEIHGHLTRSDNDQKLAEFVKRIRVYRGIRRLQIDLEIEPLILPSALADRSYYAHRFAWGASAARIRGTLQQSQFVAGERRIESTGPIEIDDNDHRLTLISDHLPFHQRTEMRMLDSLLIVHGETRRKFSCEIAIDHPHATRAAADVFTPVRLKKTERLPSRTSAWLFHVNAPSIQLINMLSDQKLPACETGTDSQADAKGYRFDFIETEGRHVTARLSTFKPPRRAWEIDFTGKIQSDLNIQEDQIVFEAQPCDYISILVEF